ncbi:MAG TPA: hypothetical protein VFF73_09690 [Planctomycetota bacterium]|nr:hypothetical protein [Planctomycetota bacterium]
MRFILLMMGLGVLGASCVSTRADTNIPREEKTAAPVSSDSNAAALGQFVMPHANGVVRLIRGSETVQVEVHCVIKFATPSAIEERETIGAIDSLSIAVVTSGGGALVAAGPVVDDGWIGGSTRMSGCVRQDFVLPARGELEAVTIVGGGVERRYRVPDFLRR